MKPNTDNLHRLLHEWQDVPAPTHRLAEPVRQRIARGTSGSAWVRWLQNEFGEYAMAFAQPRFVALCLATGIVLGASLAEWRMWRQQVRVEQEWTARYLRLIDPVGTTTKGRTW